MQSHTLHYYTIAIAFNFDPKLLHGADGIETVVTLQKAGNVTLAFGYGGQHHRAMGHRLVARYPYRTLDTSARFAGKSIH
jgi:hypothetical protein